MHIKALLTLHVAAILGGGCDSLPEKPPQPPSVITVEKPVTVYKTCPAEMPTEPKHLPCTPVDDSDQEWLRCELIKAKELPPYVLELKTQLLLCIEQK